MTTRNGQQMDGVRTTDEGLHRPPDTRSLLRKATDWLAHPYNAATAVVCSSLGAIPQPALAWLSPVVIAFVLLVHLPRIEPRRLVLRMPAVEGGKDLGDPMPGRRNHFPARGIIHLGNDMERGNCQLWLSADDACTHMLMLGTTGAGKTFNFVAFAANIIASGSGLAMSDAKGDPKLAWEFGAVAARFGREDDFLMVSMLTVGRDPTSRTSNRMNPFAQMNADGIVQLLSALAPEAEGGNAIFVKMGITLLRGVVNVLVYLRDHHGEPLSVGAIRSSISLAFLEQCWEDTRLPEQVTRTLRAFAKDINFAPKSERGVDKLGNPNPPGQSTLEQFQYAAMNFTDALASLADTYGHVYASSFADVDTLDVVRQRRLLVIMLPALEKSREELKTTGRLILAGLRDAVSKGIGSGVEGTRADVLEASGGALPPFGVFSDEHGQIAVPGIGTVMAQARSLRVMVVIGSQGWSKLYEGDKGEATEIWDNARTKAAGSLEDQDGYDRFAKQAGQVAVTEAPGLEMPAGSWFGGYRRDKNVGVTMRDRLNFQDLQRQIEGEIHLIARGTLIRAQTFNPAITGKLPLLTVARFLPVGEPPAAPEFGSAVAAVAGPAVASPTPWTKLSATPAPTPAAPAPPAAPVQPAGSSAQPLPQVMKGSFAARSLGGPIVMPPISEPAGSVVRDSAGNIEGVKPADSTFDVMREFGDFGSQEDDPFDGYAPDEAENTPLDLDRAEGFFGGIDASGLEEGQMAVSVREQIEADGGVSAASLLVALQTAPMPDQVPDPAVVRTYITEAVAALVAAAAKSR